MAEEVQEIIYRRRLDGEIAGAFEHIVDVNQAHVLMLAEQGLVADADGRALARALVELEGEGPSALGRDPAREDVHFNFEATLIARAGGAAGGRLHIGRSRNDMGATIDRMRARAGCLQVARLLCEVREQALAQARRHADTVMPGYTHLQPAQPMTFGFYCLGVAMALARDHRRLVHGFGLANLSPMGAAAFAGTSFEIDRPRLAELLGFEGLVEHALDAVASRDFLADLGGVCTGIGTTWSRLAQDLYVWSTEEFGLVEFPDRVSGTSSIMPQKKNPVVLEHLKATAAQNLGALVALHATMRGSHFTNSIDGVRASTAGAWQILETTQDSLKLVRLMLETCTPRPERMLARVRETFATVTDLAELLVQAGEVTFRDAHHLAGAVVRAALDRGLSAEEVTPEMVDAAARLVLGRSLPLGDAMMRSWADPEASIARRRSRGGPSAPEVRRLEAEASAVLKADRRQVDDLAGGLGLARGRLKDAIGALAGA